MRFLAVLMVVAAPAIASAQGFRVDVSTGFELNDAFQEVSDGGLEDDLDGGLALSVIVAQRTGNLQLGGSLEVVGGFFGPDTLRGSAVGGLVADLGLNQRFELLGELGLSRYTDIGDGFQIESIEGDSTATLFFAGARLGYQHDLMANGALAAGGWFTYRLDLTRDEAKVMVVDCFDLCSTENRSYDVGGSHYGFMFAVTWTPGRAQPPAAVP